MCDAIQSLIPNYCLCMKPAKPLITSEAITLASCVQLINRKHVKYIWSMSSRKHNPQAAHAYLYIIIHHVNRHVPESRFYNIPLRMYVL